MRPFRHPQHRAYTDYCNLYAMENTTQHNYMTLEDQAEFLATQWMSAGQLEKAGESSCLFSVFRGNA